MAFISRDGESVSYDAHDLIEELKEDIAEFGGDKLVYVITQSYKDVTIYKDYESVTGGPCDFIPGPDEEIVTMTMSKLLPLYEEECKIF